MKIKSTYFPLYSLQLCISIFLWCRNIFPHLRIMKKWHDEIYSIAQTSARLIKLHTRSFWCRLWHNTSHIATTFILPYFLDGRSFVLLSRRSSLSFHSFSPQNNRHCFTGRTADDLCEKILPYEWGMRLLSHTKEKAGSLTARNILQKRGCRERVKVGSNRIEE